MLEALIGNNSIIQNFTKNQVHNILNQTEKLQQKRLRNM